MAIWQSSSSSAKNIWAILLQLPQPNTLHESYLHQSNFIKNQILRFSSKCWINNCKMCLWLHPLEDFIIYVSLEIIQIQTSDADSGSDSPWQRSELYESSGWGTLWVHPVTTTAKLCHLYDIANLILHIVVNTITPCSNNVTGNTALCAILHTTTFVFCIFVFSLNSAIQLLAATVFI